MHDNHLSSQKAQTTAEYALIISLTAVFIIIVLAALGVKLSSIYCGVVGLFGNTPSQCATGQLLFDPFDNLNAWSFPTGNGWKNVDDQLCSTAGGENRAFTGDTNWTDYTVQADQAKMTQGNGYGIYFRASHEPSINGYVFQYDPAIKAVLTSTAHF